MSGQAWRALGVTGDYARLGAPLTLIVIAVIVFVIPFVWTLTAH